MELNTASLSDFVKLANVLWLKGKESVPHVCRNSGLFQETPIPQNSGNTREFSEIDTQEYAKIKAEGDQSERAQIQQGYTKTMYQYRVALDIGITYEMRTQNKYIEVTNRLKGLGRQVANRMELDMSHRIGFAASTSYTNMDGDSKDLTVGDGKALAATDHTLRGSSTTFRNILANNPKLSKGALESMERLITEETYNQFAEKMTMPFNILFTTDDPNTVNTAKEYLQATADPEGANTGVPNVNKAKYTHVILPLIITDANGATDSTKRYYWGLASSMYSTAYLGVWEEPRLKTPESTDSAEEFSTDDWNFGARGGYGLCTVSASWFKMSKGDGS